MTFAKDVARIFNKHCVECHHSGAIGPFSLTSYEEAVGWADTISEVVRQGCMPPWHADPKYGHFANDNRLGVDEKKTIADWIQAGTPEGDPKDMPAPPSFATGWRIPKPDVVFTIPKPFKVKASGAIDYQFFVIDTGFTEDKWVQAAEVKPGCRAVVHHVLVFVQPPGEPLVLTPGAFDPERGGGGRQGRGPGAGSREAVLPGAAVRDAVARAAATVTVALSASGSPQLCPEPDRRCCRTERQSASPPAPGS
jgi:Cytochrome C oxidase, cbb3-type, subunit III